MADCNNNLFEAMSILIDGRLLNLKLDKTIEGEIVSIVDVNTGEYKVKYLNNTFSAFSNDLNKKYKIGDAVYVEVPQGDFSNKKFIKNTTNKRTVSTLDNNLLSNIINPQGPNFNIFYPDKQHIYDNVWKLCAGSDTKSVTVWERNGLDSDTLFQQYADKFLNMQLSADFRTLFLTDHVKGNYGLELEFNASGGTTAKYRLDFSSFVGNPYRFNKEYSTQSAVFTFPVGFLRGLEKITFFLENFVKELDDNNILMKNLKLQFVDVYSALDNPYYLNIKTPLGTVVSTNKTSIELIGELYHDKENILFGNEKKCVCGWFVRDLSVTVGSDNYEKIAGCGWRRITDGVNFNKLTVKNTQVAGRKEFKLVVTYNNEITVDRTVEIVKEGYSNLYLIQETIGTDIILRISDKTKKGLWYVEYPDLRYEKLDKAASANYITVQDYLIYEFVTFYCSIENELDDLSYILKNSSSLNDLSVVYEGDSQFRYDANGDIAIEENERAHSLKCRVQWKEGFGTSYSVKWKIGDTIITTSGTETIKNSLMSNVKVDKDGVLWYNISKRYRTGTVNTVTLIIETIAGQTYTFLKEIIFLKDGDQGTNGTSYVVAVRPCLASEPYALDMTYRPVCYNNGNFNIVQLRAFVYKNGELLGNGAFSTKWTCYGIKESAGSASHDRIYVTDTEYTNKVRYVKAEVTITDNKLKINTFYPIDLFMGSADTAATYNMSYIPNTVKYTPLGLNPQYGNNNLMYYVNAMKKESSDLFKGDIVKVRDNLAYLNPPNKFDGTTDPTSQTTGMKVITIDDKIYHTVILFLDLYGNETINGWDGVNLLIDNKDQYILAPMIGAGEKESDNTFTGIVMGKDSSNKKIGLYGYQNGVNTYGLKADGTAFFGVGSGTINIGKNSEGKSEAIIYGGLSAGGDNSMTLRLHDDSFDDSDVSVDDKRSVKAIEIKNSNSNSVFSVDYTGKLTAINADISGTIINGNTRIDSNGSIYTRNLYVAEGKLGCSLTGTASLGYSASGGWLIKNDGIYSGNNSNDSNFYIDTSGSTAKLYVRKVKSDGTIDYDNGYITSGSIRTNSIRGIFRRENEEEGKDYWVKCLDGWDFSEASVVGISYSDISNFQAGVERYAPSTVLAVFG